MLERKRAARGYTAVAGDIEGQESGVVRPTVDEELERWDENAEDWETTEPEPMAAKKSFDDGGDLGEGKKRND
jgi:hypothetical protein